MPHSVVWPLLDTSISTDPLKALSEVSEGLYATPPTFVSGEHFDHSASACLRCICPDDEVAVSLAQLLDLRCFTDPKPHAQPKPEMTLELLWTGFDQGFNLIVFQGANLLASGLDFVTGQINLFTHVIVLVGPQIERSKTGFFEVGVLGFSHFTQYTKRSVMRKHRIWVHPAEEFVQNPSHGFDVDLGSTQISEVIEVASCSFFKGQALN